MHPFVDRQEAIEQFQALIDFEHPIGKPFLQFYGMGVLSIGEVEVNGIFMYGFELLLIGA